MSGGANHHRFACEGRVRAFLQVLLVGALMATPVHATTITQNGAVVPPALGAPMAIHLARRVESGETAAMRWQPLLRRRIRATQPQQLAAREVAAARVEMGRLARAARGAMGASPAMRRPRPRLW